MVILTDPSEYGLDTVLIQNGRPITFPSKTFTDVETRYANIECEYLSVCFGLEKLHAYVCGRHIIVHNDHKPLEMIQKKPIHAASPIYNECFYEYKSTIIPYSTNQGKKWSWKIDSADFPQEKKTCQLNYTKISSICTSHLTT